MTLTDFLLTRIAEKEAAAKVGPTWEATRDAVIAWWDRNEDEPGFYADDQPDDVKGLAKTLLQIDRARHDPTHVLAECAAQRAIVAAHRYSDGGDHCCASSDPYGEEMYYDWDACPTLAALAAIYAEHPGFREEWMPDA